MTQGVEIFGGLIALGLVLSVLERTTRSTSKKGKSAKRKQGSANRSKTKAGSNRRPDDILLHSRLEDLNWAEFERLLYLYFSDNGYDVIEQGVGGNDGGVDLVLIDKRTKERTAVQAKLWGHGPVGPNIIRELHSARMNMKPACIYGLLVTSNDVTQQARDEAEARHMKYWHGAFLEHKLEQWGKWKPDKRAVRKLSKQAADSTAKAHSNGQKCVCGAHMVRRKNRRGEAFWGCSTYPKCRHTVDISH